MPTSGNQLKPDGPNTLKKATKCWRNDAKMVRPIGAAHLITRSNKPLTQEQMRVYKALRGIGLSKEDSARVARDPGVKKGEWGWMGNGVNGPVECVRNDGSEGSQGLMKYKNNVVVE
jgi:hypothetical protein